MFRIINTGVYRRPEKMRQRLNHPWISLGISGQIRVYVYDPQDRLMDHYDAGAGTEQPTLSVGLPGFVSDFEYGVNRENWVIVLDWDGLRYDEISRKILLRYRETELEIPRQVGLEKHEVAFFRQQFSGISEYFHSALPRNQFTAEIMTRTLLLRFLQTPTAKDDAVELLRKRLDADRRQEKSIQEHCRELGIGRDQIRQRFMARYKITPGEYRIRKRLQRILYLFAYSDLTFKEIAYDTGMRNVTHLNMLLRKYYDKTPRELCREYRSSPK